MLTADSSIFGLMVFCCSLNIPLIVSSEVKYLTEITSEDYKVNSEMIFEFFLHSIFIVRLIFGFLREK